MLRRRVLQHKSSICSDTHDHRGSSRVTMWYHNGLEISVQAINALAPNYNI